MKGSLRLLPGLFAVTAIFAGCTFRAMQPARQLDRSETVRSATLKDPGIVTVSYVAGQWQTRLKSGDMDLQVLCTWRRKAANKTAKFQRAV